jgi:hypothetical protein
MSGIHQWESGQTIRSPSRGSVTLVNTLLPNAFTEQTTMRWENFVKGRITSAWRVVFEAMHTSKRPAEASRTWSKQLIHALWDYSRQLWAFRNSILHGQDLQDKRQKDKEKLRGKVEALFDIHANDPLFITQAMNHLFNKPLQYILSMDHDAITCWVKSVEEANLARVHTESVSQGSILQFLQPRGAKRTSTIKSASHESSRNQLGIAPTIPSRTTSPARLLPMGKPNNPPMVSFGTRKPAHHLSPMILQQEHTPMLEQTSRKKVRCKQMTRHRWSMLRGTSLRTRTGVASKRQANSEAIPRDFSGTYLSMVP